MFIVKQPALNPTARATQLDKVDDSTTYVGRAAPGTLTSAAAWQIQKLSTVDEDLAVTWADGGAYSQVWDNRASLTYT